MLTISQLAAKYNISNHQVHDLIDFGYLNIAGIKRDGNKGFTYLFAEEEIEALNLPSLLQEIKERKTRPGNRVRKKTNDFKQVIRLLDYYDRFMENVSYHPEKEFLEVCFYLFHLNHYAKTYTTKSNALYRLKNKVLKKLYREKPHLMEAIYLLGPDRNKIWLCEDCKEAARAANQSYVSYLKAGKYCPKCSISPVEKEYYSLVEFKVDLDGFKFTFHLPRSSALKWLKELDQLPQGVRQMNHYDDRMYLYGRSVSRCEEKVLPLNYIEEKLQQYLDKED